MASPLQEASDEILSFISPETTINSFSDKSEISENVNNDDDDDDEDFGPSSIKKPKLDDTTENSIL